MGFQRKGRNPQGNSLPSVSEGQVLSPSHINELSAGIDKASLRSGKGYRFVQSAGGTSLQITNNPVLPPWSVFTFGLTLCIKAGNVWGKGIAERPKQSSRSYGIGKGDFTQKFWSSRLLMVDIPNSNILCTDEINSEKAGKQTGFITLPYEAGIYYIEYGEWDGGEGEAASGSVAKELAGTQQFILKKAAITEPPTGNDDIVVVCVVDEGLAVYQGAIGDIWFGGAGETTPFKISIYDKGNKVYRVKVKQGAVNNTLAKYANIADPDMDKKEGLPIEDGQGVSSVFLRIAYAEGENFPASLPEVVVLKTTEVPIPTEEEFTLLLGRITVTKEGEGNAQTTKFAIQQIVSGSVWVERFVVGDAVPIYWATKV